MTVFWMCLFLLPLGTLITNRLFCYTDRRCSCSNNTGGPNKIISEMPSHPLQFSSLTLSSLTQMGEYRSTMIWYAHTRVVLCITGNIHIVYIKSVLSSLNRSNLKNSSL